jgi:hypothetical protein
MEIILAITILVLVFVLIVLIIALVNEKDFATLRERQNQTERANLIDKHIKDRENLAAKYEREHQKLIDKMLKRGGISPLHEEKKEPVIENKIVRDRG